MDLLHGAGFAGQNGLVKAAAVRAVALMLDDIEKLVALVALGNPRNDIHHQLRLFQNSSTAYPTTRPCSCT